MVVPLAAYFQREAAAFGLPHEFTVIRPDSPEPGVCLSVKMDDFDRLRVTVFVGREWDGLSDEDKTVVVGHELAHILTDIYASMVEAVIEPDSDAGRLLAAAEERMCNIIGTALANRMTPWGVV